MAKSFWLILGKIVMAAGILLLCDHCPCGSGSGFGSGSGSGAGGAGGGGVTGPAVPIGPPWDGGDCNNSGTVQPNLLCGTPVPGKLFLTITSVTGNCGCLTTGSIPLCRDSTTNGWDSPNGPTSGCGRPVLWHFVGGGTGCLFPHFGDSGVGGVNFGNTVSCSPVLFQGTLDLTGSYCQGRITYTVTE